MNDLYSNRITNSWIISSRGRKNLVHPETPYSWLVEKECTPEGKIEDVATIFLSNRECPFKCLMCDLWKNTTDEPVKSGDIPAQIRWVLKQLPGEIKHLKLYNSGSFFDEQAIPSCDYEEIAEIVKEFTTIIVESHPAFIGKRCTDFRDLLKPELQIAIGLEAGDNSLLKKLNKKMTTEDFSSSVHFLKGSGIKVRAFILLRPPFLDESEGVLMAERSIDFAYNSGAECCVVIPVRGGNGAMEVLKERGLFSPPDVRSLEKVLEYGIGLKRGRVFADTWDLELFTDCLHCLDERKKRLTEMNLYQRVAGPVKCTCDTL